VDATGIVGPHTSLALDAQGNPRISYFDGSNGDLKYAIWSAAGWSIETVPDPGGVVGQYCSLVFDPTGLPNIAYYDATNTALKLARKSGTNWIIETIPAGAFPAKTIGPGECARIFTGAPLPQGADSVVRQEDTEQQGEVVHVRSGRDAGVNIRLAGEDVRAGSVVLEDGVLLGAAEIGVLASLAVAHPVVHRTIAHRLQRESKVVEAMRSVGAGDVNVLLPIVYGDVPERLHPVAARSLRAHLLKLQADGRAVEAGGRWSLREAT